MGVSMIEVECMNMLEKKNNNNNKPSFLILNKEAYIVVGAETSPWVLLMCNLFVYMQTI